jgi:uncharacterized protein
MPVVVSDTSPLVYLTRLVGQGAAYPESKQTQLAVQTGWIKVRKPERSIAALADLDPGEREAIALAQELGALLIIDEAEGRQAAVKLGIRVTGTLGLLIEAKSRGLIPRVRDELDALMERTTFRISDELRKLVLQQAGELEAN